MFENNYNTETNTKETEYVPTADVMQEQNEKKKKGGFKKFLKAVFSLCLVAGVGAGSVFGYKYIKDHPFDKENGEDTKSVVTQTKAPEEYVASPMFSLSKSEGSLTPQEIYKKCIPSVVGVTSTFDLAINTGNGFFGGGSNSKQAVGTGTGIVMSEDGYIITNAHVICDTETTSKAVKASKVSVMLSDKNEYDAEIVGYDTQADVALLKIDAPNLTAAEFGDSAALEVGDSAYAIGNPLGFDLFGTLTVGYVSGLDREVGTDASVISLIQTDAAINNGNSGGPLINDKGQVIGINSMKLSNTYTNQAMIEGLGFAIPMNQAMDIVSQLKDNGKVIRTKLGISCTNITSQNASQIGENVTAADGVYVSSVEKDSACDKAGIKEGDIIVGVDDASVQNINELNQIKNKHKAGDKITLKIIREKKFETVEVVLQADDSSEEDTEQQAADNNEQQTPDYGKNPELPKNDGGQGSNGGSGQYDPFGDFFGDFFGGGLNPFGW